MKTETKKKWLAIAVFYALAIVIRAITLEMDNPTSFNLQFWLIAWGEGIGPCVGALVAVLVFKRKFYCSITGTSIVKSLLSVSIPFLVCFVLHQQLSFILLGFIFYSFLEEVGWRGYLQGELQDMNPVLQVVIIGTMWLIWHINIGFDIQTLIFWAVLLLGAWGIGRVAYDTHSLMTCACFHTLFNFSKHGFFQFTPLVIAIYVGVIASWFLIWYVPWDRVVSRKK